MASQQESRKRFRNLVLKWDVFTFERMQGDSTEGISSIFFSEFLDRIRAIDIFKLFDCSREVMEVVISPQRNKLGRSFGFTRFKGVEDVKLLAVKLDNVLIDGEKIYANQPMFARNGFIGEVGKSLYQEGKSLIQNNASKVGFRVQKRSDILEEKGVCLDSKLMSRLFRKGRSLVNRKRLIK